MDAQKTTGGLPQDGSTKDAEFNYNIAWLLKPMGDWTVPDGRVAVSKQRWSREAFNAYQREYMRKRREKAKEESEANTAV